MTTELVSQTMNGTLKSATYEECNTRYQRGPGDDEHLLFQIAMIYNQLDTAAMLWKQTEQDSYPQVIGDRYWNHLAIFCEVEGLKYLHQVLGWDLGDPSNGDEYGRTLITIFAHDDQEDKVKCLYDMGYRIYPYSERAYVDGPYTDNTTAPKLSSKYLKYIATEQEVKEFKERYGKQGQTLTIATEII